MPPTMYSSIMIQHLPQVLPADERNERHALPFGRVFVPLVGSCETHLLPSPVWRCGWDALNGRLPGAVRPNQLPGTGVVSHRPHGLKPGGLQLPREGRHVRRYDCRPAANVNRRVQVRVGGEPT